MARHFPILRTIRLSRTERSRPFPTNLPEVRNLPSKFTDSLNPLKQNVSADLFFSSLPCLSAKRPQSRRERFFPLVRHLSRLPCSVPHRRSFAFLRCSRYSRHGIATDVPCARPVCKRPGSVSALCAASFPYSWTSRPHRGSQVPLHAFPTLPFPAVVSS